MLISISSLCLCNGSRCRFGGLACSMLGRLLESTGPCNGRWSSHTAKSYGLRSAQTPSSSKLARSQCQAVLLVLHDSSCNRAACSECKSRLSHLSRTGFPAAEARSCPHFNNRRFPIGPNYVLINLPDPQSIRSYGSPQSRVDSEQLAHTV